HKTARFAELHFPPDVPPDVFDFAKKLFFRTTHTPRFFCYIWKTDFSPNPEEAAEHEHGYGKS
ncbi:MAG: hypothetical protein MPK10_09260, partial [Gammaproteobacteria bacterium]|nr:hypothetical protein [Gammaproteobacteria bacterium]